MIEIKNLNVYLGKAHILNNVNLEIEEKDSIIGIFGPNGAGKTTLINTLTGSINNYTGEIYGINPKEISYLPDKAFIYRSMKLEDAIKYYKDAFLDFDAQKAERLMSSLGLNLKQKISQCSKGMSEQIHMVLAICRNVSVYIFDEPLAAVDPLTRDDIMEMIKNERKKGSIVLISTHLISDVESLFNDVIMVKNGCVVLHEDVEKLKAAKNESLEEIFKEKLR